MSRSKLKFLFEATEDTMPVEDEEMNNGVGPKTIDYEADEPTGELQGDYTFEVRATDWTFDDLKEVVEEMGGQLDARIGLFITGQVENETELFDRLENTFGIVVEP